MAVYGSLSATQKAVVDAAGDVSSVSANLENIASLLEANNSAYEGVESGASSVESGAAQIAQGASELKDNYAQFDIQIQSLPVLLQNMITDQMDTLVTAINTLTDQYPDRPIQRTGCRNRKLYTGSGSGAESVQSVLKCIQSGCKSYRFPDKRNQKPENRCRISGKWRTAALRRNTESEEWNICSFRRSEHPGKRSKQPPEWNFQSADRCGNSYFRN